MPNLRVEPMRRTARLTRDVRLVFRKEPMEHPWILLSSVVASSPLIWRTFQFFFPN
jgi:hypothetical protein